MEVNAVCVARILQTPVKDLGKLSYFLGMLIVQNQERTLNILYFSQGPFLTSMIYCNKIIVSKYRILSKNLAPFLLFPALTCPKNGELSMKLATAGLYYSFPFCRTFDSIRNL